jgi:hypothetical protein
VAEKLGALFGEKREKGEKRKEKKYREEMR